MQLPDDADLVEALLDTMHKTGKLIECSSLIGGGGGGGGTVI